MDEAALRVTALDLWARWNGDVATATLLARRDHPALGRLVPYGQAIVAEVETAASSLAAPPTAQSAFQRRFASYNARTFLAMLTAVAASDGDPPVPRSWQERAYSILNGRAAPDAAMLEATERVELLPGELGAMVADAQAAGFDARPLVWAAGRLAAALSLPREQLVQLFGGPGAPQATPAQAAAVVDPAAALDRAATTPTPADDIAALQAILLVSPPAEPPLLRRGAERAIALVDAGHGGDELAQIVAFLELRAPLADLAADLDPGLSDAALRLLETPLSPLMQMTLRIQTSRALVRRGRPDLAEDVLARLPADLPPDDRLQVACLDAEIRIASSDNEGATAALVAALEGARGGGFEARWQALSTLLAAWPGERPGLEPWIAEYEALLPAADGALAQLGRRQVDLARQKAAGAGEAPT